MNGWAYPAQEIISIVMLTSAFVFCIYAFFAAGGQFPPVVRTDRGLENFTSQGTTTAANS